MNNFIIDDAVKARNNRFPDEFVDLTVSSPPYERLRDYNGFKFNPDSISLRHRPKDVTTGCHKLSSVFESCRDMVDQQSMHCTLPICGIST